jgi:4-hydroxy-tetrahydrodipicolinate reductase
MTVKSLGVWIHGSSGRMGQEIQAAVVESNGTFNLIGGSSRKFVGQHTQQGKTVDSASLASVLKKEPVDVVFDFSTTQANELLLEAFQNGSLSGKAILIGTTGLAGDAILRWKSVAEGDGLRLLFAPNTSLGIQLSLTTALHAAGILSKQNFDIEVVETHHREKVDAPSGTADIIARTIVDQTEGLSLQTRREGKREVGEVGVHSIRGGSIYGEHSIRFLGDHEEFTISHRALSRKLFAQGALIMADWLQKQPAGIYGLTDIKL